MNFGPRISGYILRFGGLVLVTCLLSGPAFAQMTRDPSAALRSARHRLPEYDAVRDAAAKLLRLSVTPHQVTSADPPPRRVENATELQTTTPSHSVIDDLKPSTSAGELPTDSPGFELPRSPQLPTPPEHSIVDDLEPVTTYTGELPPDAPSFVPPLSQQSTAHSAAGAGDVTSSSRGTTATMPPRSR